MIIYRIILIISPIMKTEDIEIRVDKIKCGQTDLSSETVTIIDQYLDVIT